MPGSVTPAILTVFAEPFYRPFQTGVTLRYVMFALEGSEPSDCTAWLQPREKQFEAGGSDYS